MKPDNRKIAESLYAAIKAARIPNLTSISITGSHDKHNRYTVYYEYAHNCWTKCVERTTQPSGRYDYTAACTLQERYERRYKKTIAQTIKAVANSIGVQVKLTSHNTNHHDKFDFDSDLFRKTGNVTFNM